MIKLLQSLFREKYISILVHKKLCCEIQKLEFEKRQTLAMAKQYELELDKCGHGYEKFAKDRDREAKWCYEQYVKYHHSSELIDELIKEMKA